MSGPTISLSRREGEVAAVLAVATRDAIADLPAESVLRSEMEQAVAELRTLALLHGVDSDREAAVRGLRDIAAREQQLAAAIDGPGYYGDLATHLSDHAAHLRHLEASLVGRSGRPRDSGPAPRRGRAHLQLVGTGCDHSDGKAAR